MAGKARGTAGFTLIELMVVIIILGLLVAIIGFRMLGRTEEARRTAAILQTRNFISALQLYRLDNGAYPTTEQGLEALVREPTTGPNPRKWAPGGYLEGGRVPPDPWGNPYIYLSPGSDGREYEIKSLGADGQEGGEGNDADIESWNLQ
ncbi:MAG: type II secretion system major pseudopilin GspG [Nitrospinota bacterium]